MRVHAPRQGIFYGWLIVGTTAFLGLLTTGSRNGFSLFIDTWSDELGWSRASISLAAAIGMLLNGLAAPFMGRIYDRVGARWVVLWSLLVLGVATMLLSLINSILHLVLIFGVVIAIAFAGASGPAMGALLSKWFYRRRGTVLSIYSAGRSAGGLIMVPFAAYLLVLTGWRVTFAVLGALVLLLALPLASLMIRNEPKDMGLLPDGDSEEDARAPSRRSAAVRPPLEVDRWQDSYRSPPIWQLSAAYFVCGATTGILHIHFVPYVIDQEYSKGLAAMAFGLMSAMNFIGVLAVGTISDKVGRKNMLAAVYLTRAVGYATLLFAPGPLAIWGGAIIAGLSWLATSPLTTSLTAEVYGLKSVGALSGMVFMTHQAGSAASIYLGGLLYDRYGSYTIPFAIAGAMLLVASLLSFSIREKRYSVRYCPLPATAPGLGY